MAASAPILKTIYLGAFAHSVSLAELEICAKGAIGVDDAGVIAFVERDIDIEEVKRRHEGWNGARVVEVKDGFYFPGFIGKFFSFPAVHKLSIWIWNVAKRSRARVNY
jgi:guanine deaminase